MKLINRNKNTIVAERVIVANSFWYRLKGLMGQSCLTESCTLWIPRCDSIHTCFMKFPIDVVFVDSELIVRRMYRNLQPWRLVMPRWSNKSVFEFSSGVVDATSTELGDQLYVGD